VIDGNRVDLGKSFNYLCIEKADDNVPQVSAASVVAKVTRDHLVDLMHILYPEYNFNIHKGYPTQAHIGRLKEKGPSPFHRNSFAFVR
jgi:ribonuclease HII